MGTLLTLLVRSHLALSLAVLSRRRPRATRSARTERGDVPGWVMVTIMTVGLIAAITAVAQPQLTSMLQSALNSVK